MIKKLDVVLEHMVVYGVEEIQVRGGKVLQVSGVNAHETREEAVKAMGTCFERTLSILREHNYTMTKSANRYQVDVECEHPFSIIYHIIEIYF